MSSSSSCFSDAFYPVWVANERPAYPRIPVTRCRDPVILLSAMPGLRNFNARRAKTTMMGTHDET